MEKERKIIKSINALQKSLFEYKQHIKQLPIEINRSEANILTHESAKNLLHTYSHLAELFSLISVLHPDILKGDFSELAMMNQKIGEIKSIIKILDMKINKEIE